MFTVPSVDDWFELTKLYPEFQRPSDTSLKDYGYMEVFRFLDARPSAGRILEFGHGFNPALFVRYGSDRETWGVDDFQSLHYFSQDRDAWERTFAEQMTQRCPPQCRFVRGLLSDGAPDSLPEGYFDVVCSVSVLEEMPLEAVAPIVRRAASLLKPGGFLIGTHDFCEAMLDRLPLYVDLQRGAGLKIDLPAMPTFDQKTLIENPTVVMTAYQMETPASQRKYWGHWTTAFTIAQKPMPSQ